VGWVDFGMSSREDPFAITVFGFGGNGSFGLVVDASRIVYVEGSLAVTFELAVDVFIRFITSVVPERKYSTCTSG
jgi:hypothetical protein